MGPRKDPCRTPNCDTDGQANGDHFYRDPKCHKNEKRSL